MRELHEFPLISLQTLGKGKVIPVLCLNPPPWRRIGEWSYSYPYSSTHSWHRF